MRLRLVVAAGLLFVAAVALSGCALSGRTAMPPTRLDLVRSEISAARASDRNLFAIFPAQPGMARCTIPVNEGMRDSKLEGTCRTRVWYPNTHGHGEARVVFRESWGKRGFSSWTLWEELPATKVLVTKLHGEPAPQLRYAATGRKHLAAVHYRPENLTLYAARPGYRPAVSRSEVLRLYRHWPAGPKLKGTPTVQLRLVNDGNPNPSDRDYPGWVLTFRHTKPTSYGPASVSQKAVCAWVSIYDLRTRVWTEDFQSCPSRPTPGSSCDAGCTPANQPALDAATNYAEQVAGAAHCYAGAAVDDDANKVLVYLVHAPRPILDKLRARHPGIYVIRNAPHTLSDIVALQHSIDWSAWQKRGIDIVSTGPTETGYLSVAVTTNVGKAQAAFDAKYGRGIIRVVHGEPATFGGLTYPAPKHPVQGVVAVRSTRSQQANAVEVRQWRRQPIAVFTNGDGSVLRFVLPANGCKPQVSSAHVVRKTLTLFLRRASGCTLIARFYEVTVSLVKPDLGQKLTSVVARFPKAGGSQRMRLAEVVYG